MKTPPAAKLVALFAVAMVCQSSLGFYNPATGRWLSRDPIGERGGPALASQTDLDSFRTVHDAQSGFRDDANSYLSVGNDAVSKIDLWGLVVWNPNQSRRLNVPESDGQRTMKGEDVLVYTLKHTPLVAWRPISGEPQDIGYWCHGYTFDGHSAQGGPYSIRGDAVPKVLRDEDWVPVCCGMASYSDIVVFSSGGQISHSAKILSSISDDQGNGYQFNQNASTTRSKNGFQALGTMSFAVLQFSYGDYTCYSKRNTLRHGCCPNRGAGEHLLPSAR
jgi:hypothetical protein